MFIILGADGKEYGPVHTGAVAAWIREGRASLQTKARLSSETKWQTLGDFAEFGLRPGAPAPASLPPPVADAPVAANMVAAAAPASRWLRLPAAMIDGLLKTLCYLPITVPLCRAMFSQALAGEQRSFAEITTLTNQIVSDHFMQAAPWFALLAALQLGLLATRAQSVGKLLLKLRIVSEPDGAPAGVGRVIFLRSCVPFVIEQIPGISILFWVVDSCFIFRSDHRCLHDLIAGTKVVPS